MFASFAKRVVFFRLNDSISVVGCLPKEGRAKSSAMRTSMYNPDSIVLHEQKTYSLDVKAASKLGTTHTMIKMH